MASKYSNLTFKGYRRENGRVGVRNHVAILPATTSRTPPVRPWPTTSRARSPCLMPTAALGGREIWDEATVRLDGEGVPLVDDFRMTPGVAHVESEAAYRSLVADLPEGLTFLALHPNSPGDIEMIVPPRAHFRTDENRLLGNGHIAEWLETEGIQTLGMRALRELYRQQPQPKVMSR